VDGPRDEQRLTTLLAGARVGCLISGAIGIGLFVVAVAYEGVIARTFATPNLFVIALGVAPAGTGLYVCVRALLRGRTLGRIVRRPETIQLAELAMRWGLPAVRVTFADGASETFSTGKVDRNLLLDALRRRGVARGTPVARVRRK
jgi:hypothetical protein